MQTKTEYTVREAHTLLKAAMFPLEGQSLEDAIAFTDMTSNMSADDLRILLTFAYNIIGTQNQLMALRVKTEKKEGM